MSTSPTSATRNENRLTDPDVTTMRRAIAECIQTAVQQSTTGHPAHDREVLRRVGAHSIGCALHDLRDSELDALDRMVTEGIHTSQHP